MTDGGTIDFAFEPGKILLDIELPSGSCSIDLSVSQCAELIQELTQAMLAATSAARAAS